MKVRSMVCRLNESGMLRVSLPVEQDSGKRQHWGQDRVSSLTTSRPCWKVTAVAPFPNVQECRN